MIKLRVKWLPFKHTLKDIRNINIYKIAALVASFINYVCIVHYYIWLLCLDYWLVCNEIFFSHHYKICFIHIYIWYILFWIYFFSIWQFNFLRANFFTIIINTFIFFRLRFQVMHGYKYNFVISSVKTKWNYFDMYSSFILILQDESYM